MTTVWRICTIYHSPRNQATLVRLCNEGWEPFAVVTVKGAMHPTVYLRKVVDEDAAKP